MTVRQRRAATPILLMLGVAAGCGGAPAGRPGSAPSPVAGSSGAFSDTVGGGMVPAGYGTLRQDDIAIKLQVQDVLVRLVPLDEGVIRVLSPDSYQALRQLAESRNDQLARLTTLHGLRERRLWFVTFFGLAPDARFTPTDVTITAAGREYRPLEIIPLGARFGEQRLQPRDSQSAIYLFEDGLDVSQPVVVISGSQRNAGWQESLRAIERERALIRSRAGRGKTP